MGLLLVHWTKGPNSIPAHQVFVFLLHMKWTSRRSQNGGATNSMEMGKSKERKKTGKDEIKENENRKNEKNEIQKYRGK